MSNTGVFIGMKREDLACKDAHLFQRSGQLHPFSVLIFPSSPPKYPVGSLDSLAKLL